MDNTREKLIDFFIDELPEEHPWIGNVKGLVDRLIAHGVTFATDNKWIPVTERLPKKFNNALAARKCGDWFSIDVECILADGKWCGAVFYKNEVTHWMPLPEPPREE